MHTPHLVSAPLELPAVPTAAMQADSLQRWHFTSLERLELPGSFKRVALNYQGIYRDSKQEQSPWGQVEFGEREVLGCYSFGEWPQSPATSRPPWPKCGQYPKTESESLSHLGCPSRVSPGERGGQT